MHYPTERTAHTMAFVLHDVEYRLCYQITTTLKTRKEGRNFFYLMTHSNTFYLWLYGISYMVKDHSDSERGNPMSPHGLLFLISSKGSFICTIPQTG